MDNTLVLKQNLIERIKSSKNVKFLNAIQTLFDSAEEELFELNELHESIIEQGREDIKNGKSKTNEQVLNETRSWLKKK